MDGFDLDDLSIVDSIALLVPFDGKLEFDTTTNIAMLERSQIVIPNNDPYDPKGKFARSGSPTNVTREEAVELVRHPPMPGDPLPIVI